MKFVPYYNDYNLPQLSIEVCLILVPKIDYKIGKADNNESNSKWTLMIQNFKVVIQTLTCTINRHYIIAFAYAKILF